MKNKNIFIILSIFCTLLMSCSDLKFGDEFLGSEPESSGADLAEMFSTEINANKILTKAYTYLPYGIPTSGGSAYNKLGNNVLESLTDLHYSRRNNMGDGPTNLYYNGLLSSDVSGALVGTENYRFASENGYRLIRYAWMYIEHVDDVADMTEEEKIEKKAEAKMLIAIAYSEMMRYIGGVVWLDHSVDVNEDFTFPRITFAETVDKIVALIDESASNLPWKWDGVNDGRMTKAGALGLKVRVLLFAASSTFNGNKWHPEADEYSCYGDASQERWTKAKKAGDDFMDALNRNGLYNIEEPSEPTFTARRLAFRKGYYDRESSEILISTRRGYDSNVNDPLYTNRYYSGPTLNYVNMFSWADGSDFPQDFDWGNPSKQPFYGADGVATRDPRLYETVAVPGDIYFSGVPAPTYTNHPNYHTAGTGFLQMKFILQNTSDRAGKPVQWPYLRLPEILLSYAEILNEVNGKPNATAYQCINDIRARVGLSELPADLSKEAFKKAVLKERALEFGFEEVRWFDLIRNGMVDDFTKPLYELQSKGNDNYNPTAFTFKTNLLATRYWAENWNTKWYLAPIPQVEINKKYGMTQNPGW